MVVKAGVMEDFSTDPRPLHSDSIHVKKSNEEEKKQEILLFGRRFFPPLSSYVKSKDAFEASKKSVSKKTSSNSDLTNTFTFHGFAPSRIVEGKLL